MLRSMVLALSWRSLRHEGPVDRKGPGVGVQKRLCFLLGGRGAGQRVRGESHPTCGDPRQRASAACRSALGQQEGVGWAWAPRPDDWTGATWATSPGLKGEEEPHVSSQQPPHYCVWGENRVTVATWN